MSDETARDRHVRATATQMARSALTTYRTFILNVSGDDGPTAWRHFLRAMHHLAGEELEHARVGGSDEDGRFN